MANKKIEKLKQVHGKDETFKATTLNQIWGDTGASKYKTLDVAEYTETLRGLNKSDLIAHSVKVGVVPVDNREMTVKKLIAEFKRHVSSYKRPSEVPQKPKTPSQNILSILAEGR
jgi:hypothetical protein